MLVKCLTSIQTYLCEPPRGLVDCDLLIGIGTPDVDE